MKAITIIENCNCKGCPANRASTECVICLNGRTKREQVPESFADLKELCKDLKGLYKNYNIEVFDDAIFVLDSKAVLLKVYDDGEIKDSGSEVIADNRTSEQMWQVIKGLVGE